MYTISKQFEFCAGHRVWSQTLDSQLSDNSNCKCRWLHGHNYMLTVELQGYKLDGKGMVLDFNELLFVKKIVDKHFDHKCILDINDPLRKSLIPTYYNEVEPVLITNEIGCKVVDPKQLDSLSLLKKEERELYESFIIVNFLPTSENLSKFFYDLITNILTPYNITVKSVAINETPKTQSIYSK